MELNPEAVEWVAQEDAACRDERAERLSWLMRSYPRIEYVAFPGGLVTKQLFEEARYAFIQGMYAASVLLALAFVERCLAALFFAAGRNDLERASITKLANEARGVGALDDDYFEKLQAVRESRNPLAHFRRFGAEDSIEVRAITSMNELSDDGLLPDEIAANDALLAMKLVHETLKLYCQPASFTRFKRLIDQPR